MSANNKITNEWLDDAAAEALCTNTAAESVAFQQRMSRGGMGANAERVNTQLRETVAQLASTSPHMTPPADLRGRILQATAPANFKMEDYRKANQDSGKFYRWGFYAAMAFLMAGAWFNVHTQTALKQANNTMTAMHAKEQKQAEALATLISPKAQQVSLMEEGKLLGRAFVDENSKRAVVLLPKELVPAGKTIQFSLPKNGQDVAYDTMLITVPANEIVPSMNKSLDVLVHVQDLAPDTTYRTSIAGH